MSLKHVFGGRLSGAVLLSVPLCAMLALGPMSSSSQADNLATSTSGDLNASVGNQKIESLSNWKYTGNSMKSIKSDKSKKSKSSTKSKKSKK